MPPRNAGGIVLAAGQFVLQSDDFAAGRDAGAPDLRDDLSVGSCSLARSIGDVYRREVEGSRGRGIISRGTLEGEEDGGDENSSDPLLVCCQP